MNEDLGGRDFGDLGISLKKWALGGQPVAKQRWQRTGIYESMKRNGKG
jgi:hypothetical protein